jgi:hypothetical protein
MTNFAISTPSSKLYVNMSSSYNFAVPPSTATTPSPYQPDMVPNPLNSRSGGFLVSSIMGGIEANKMGKIVFGESSEIKPELSSQTTGLFQRTGINMGVGAAVFGTLSVLKQGFGIVSGHQDGKGALANITADILRGGGAGLGASVGGGLSSYAMKAMGATGTFGTVMTVIGGIVGANLGAGLVEATGLRDSLVKGFGSDKIMVPQPLYPASHP